MGNMRGRRGYEALVRLVREDPSDKVREHGVFALSQSDVPEAVDAMIRVAQQDASAHVRGQALFWLGQKAGQKAVSAITRAIDDDPETEVKKKAVFALSQLPKEEGRAHADPGREDEPQPRGAQAGDVLAGAVGRFARARLLPGGVGAELTRGRARGRVGIESAESHSHARWRHALRGDAWSGGRTRLRPAPARCLQGSR